MRAAQIHLKHATFMCHPLAKTSYLFSRSAKRQFTADFSPDLISLMQEQDPLHIIQVNKKSYQFFSGWYWLPYCRENNLEKISVIKHSINTNEYIEKRAWSYLLSNELKSGHRDVGLAQMDQLMTKIPKVLRKELLGKLYRPSTGKIVELLAAETRAAVRNQRRKMGPPKAHTTILEKLIGE